MARAGLGRGAGACLRAAVMGMVVAVPVAALDGAGAAPGVALFALLAALFTASEYGAAAPTLVGFRDARPFNRIRAAALLLMLLAASALLGAGDERAALVHVVRALGARLGGALDVGGSPVRLFAGALPPGLDPALARGARDAAAVALALGLAMAGVFALALRGGAWPARGFNMWVNLPTFDPAGGDVVDRLVRDARLNLVLAGALPFLLPVALALLPRPFGAAVAGSPAALAWTVAAWAFIPGTLLMRALALARLARLVAAQRARAVGGGLQPA